MKSSRKYFFKAAVNKGVSAAGSLKKSLILIGRATTPKPLRDFGNMILEKPNQKVRRYLHPSIDTQSFFQALNDRGVSYAVLRWFDDLPEVEPEEDIDLLVADNDLGKLHDLFSVNTAGQAFDVYSVSGLHGSNYRGMPYYPPHLAREILAHTRYLNGKYHVPDSREHFMSLAYHAVFHKGGCSIERDYLTLLADIAVDSDQLESCESFDALYDYLCREGWAPQLDTQRKLSERSQWLSGKLPRATHPNPEGELIVFIIREWAVNRGKLDQVIATLTGSGLEVLEVFQLDEVQREAARKLIRGGKWDRGVYRVSGGAPAVLVPCFDYHPAIPDEAQQTEFPHLRNQNTMIKHKVRDQLNKSLFWFQQANSIHSSDDSLEAENYLYLVVPEKAKDLMCQVDKRRTSYRTTYEVVDNLTSHRTRAKVEKILFHDQVCIKKTYKNGQERFLGREIFVRQEFSALASEISPLLAQGNNYFIEPWHSNILEDLQPKQFAEALASVGSSIVGVLRLFFDNGYALVDFHPGNLILTEEGGLKVIDFEFLYRYDNSPSTFLESYDIVGVPDSFTGDLPLGHQGRGRTYENTWEPLIGKLQNYI
tara:strand:- start:415 stop:2199 length:1785 start_codon:yes stop_codon:yes gene_type:complete